MFTFFAKKNFLVDHLEGFVDIHNHILPGIDDGAKTTEESIELIKEFSNLGMKHFIATPHIMQDYYPNNSETISKSLTKLEEELLEQGIDDILIEAAAEHMIDSNFEALLEKKEVIPLKREYLLIEMSYLQPSINFETAIDRVKSSGFFPILAHPERYVFLFSQNKRYADYKKEGVLFQLNLLSLGDFYGLEVKKTALKILGNGQVDFLGSDVHHMNHIKALKEIKITKKTLEMVLPVMERTIQYFF
ncbi:tyrosine-protein phosphatase [Ulvibacterium marinum]|uniref:protein-tyrosine-phosphatase n=1 Tax=Ulvibacterium marinum TaxID=2419782 RepID=A0A3B0BVJ8_9FLAO|nr:CpsB/CapC family capsule biosynthesis tyrosine phosphatase [Ulvibacterium marinum]RKN76960.1 histidinol phosphatase [Ulvibacterium marinum]